jgi:hypothetical protein
MLFYAPDLHAAQKRQKVYATTILLVKLKQNTKSHKMTE